MALQEEDYCDADLQDQNEQFGAYGSFAGPEVKSVFQDRTIQITAGFGDQARGAVMTFANTGLVGVNDYYDPVGLGKPVVGNYIRPKKFDWKLNFTSPPGVGSGSTVVTNMVTFRLLWLLVWEFPRDIVLGATQFLEYFLDNSTGNYHQSFLNPDKVEKVRLLYDCEHTIGSPLAFDRGVYANVSAAAGGQAGYLVPPGNDVSGWTVPAATVPAVSTSVATSPAHRYGGHQMFLSGRFDLEEYEMSLWRDPLEEEEQQIVPAVICFVVCQDLFHYTPSGSFIVANRPTSQWQVYTRLTFTDE